MKLTRARLLGIVIATTYAVAWVPALVFAIEGLDVDGREGRALMVFQYFAPLVGALVGEALIRERGAARSLGLSFSINRFWFVAWFAPLFASVIGIAFTWATGTPPILSAQDLEEAKRALVAPENREAFERALATNPIQSPGMLLLMALPAGLTINAIPMLAEEIGFRGFLYREIPGGYVARSLWIGVLHGVFLMPLVLLGWGFPDAPWIGAIVTMLRSIVYSFVAVYLRARSDSVVPVAIFGGTFLALVHPCLDLTSTASSYLRPPYGVAGTVGLLVLFGLAALHDRYIARAKLMFGARATAGRT